MQHPKKQCLIKTSGTCISSSSSLSSSDSISKPRTSSTCSNPSDSSPDDSSDLSSKIYNLTTLCDKSLVFNMQSRNVSWMTIKITALYSTTNILSKQPDIRTLGQPIKSSHVSWQSGNSWKFEGNFIFVEKLCARTTYWQNI